VKCADKYKSEIGSNVKAEKRAVSRTDSDHIVYLICNTVAMEFQTTPPFEKGLADAVATGYKDVILHRHYSMWRDWRETYLTEEMVVRPVSFFVNSPKNEGPELLELANP
jgi:hypothetical protein